MNYCNVLQAAKLKLKVLNSIAIDIDTVAAPD
jgi:hypothetical protein